MWGSQYQDHLRGTGGRAVGTPCRHVHSKTTGFPIFECLSAKFGGEFGDSGWRDPVCFGLGCREQPGSLRLFAFEPDQVAMDPSPEVVSMFVDVSSIAAWCDMDEVTTVSLFSHLGIRPDMHPRVLAAIPQESLATRISFWRLDDDAAPSPAQLSQGG